LRSKSKRLAEQAILYPHPSKIKDFCHLPPGEGFIVIPFAKSSVLTIGGFFDTLKSPSPDGDGDCFISSKNP